MPDTDIAKTDTGDFENTETKFSVPSEETDSADDSKETYWENSEWSQYLGYYKKIPELKSAIDAKARWTIGKGFKSNPITEITLSAIKGFGKDSFNSILENCVRTYHIGGDSFCEIIRDKEGNLINLKPLDPGTVRIVVNGQGILKRYEQLRKVTGSDNTDKTVVGNKFDPDEIFHLPRNRLADEIHGQSIVKENEEVILALNEAKDDYKKLLHRNVYPVRIWYLDTDETSKINSFITKADKAYTQGENIFIPKGTAETELASVPTNATLNPLPWITLLTNEFYQGVGVPQIIVGGGQEITEASAKIAYLAFEQTVEEEQLFIEEQVLAQLNIEIELEFPATLQNEMLDDRSKSETMQATTPEDTAVTNVGVSPEEGLV